MDVANISIDLLGVVAGSSALLAAAWLLLRTVRRRRTAAAVQAEAVARHDEAVRAYRASAVDWQQHREELRALLDATSNGGRAEAPDGLQLQRGERVYFSTSATIDGNADREPEAGLLTVTSRRVVLQGESLHEWDLDAIAQLRHIGQDRTLLRPCGTWASVGLSYADGPLTRMYLELVTSTSGTSRNELVRNVAQGLNDHELRRPRTPVVPEPVAGLGRRARVEAAEWYVAQVAETEILRSLVDGTVRMVPTQPRVVKPKWAKPLPVAS